MSCLPVSQQPWRIRRFLWASSIHERIQMMSRCLVFATSLFLCAAPAVAQGRPLSVERIWGSNEFASSLVTIRWAPDGQSYTHVEASPGATDLYQVDAVSGSQERLITGTELVPPGSEAPIRIESYQFSADRSKLLIFTNSERVWRQNTKGEYFVWDFVTRRLLPVSRQGGLQMFAKFSPDGRLVGFVRDNDLFVSEFASDREWRITRDGSDDIINGTSDWVYEEELGLRDAFRISPDGRRIAFWRLDQSRIEPFYLIDETPLYPEIVPVRYPKAGTPNSEVRIGVAEIETGETQWIELGDETEIYVARMGFANSSGRLWLTRLNRHQNRLDLMVSDVESGESLIIFTDSDSAWVDQHEPLWFDDGERFLYLSDRHGYAQLFVFDSQGFPVRKLTTDPWDVTAVHGVDEERGVVFFSGVGEGPLQRHVYRIDLDGHNLRRLTTEPGTHVASFDPTLTHFVDTYSRAGVPPVQTLRSSDGEVIRTVASNDVLRARVAALGLREPEFMEVPGGDGGHLNAYVIKPPHFDSSRAYPLLMYVYGGPGSQTVTDAWGGDRYLWHQMLAQQGYLVASVDNRGTGARGAEFKKATYLNLGRYESEDQIAAARHFGSLDYVDPARIGIWGWSYGGYMSSLAAMRGGTVFRAAISVAPVTDWRLYDTIYTERYMRTPRENPDGYRLGAPVTYADSLEASLLVVHGTGDDNVHSQQTTWLINALENANKQFDMRVYPNKTHSIAGDVTRINLYSLFTRWLRDNLYAGSSVADQIP